MPRQAVPPVRLRVADVQAAYRVSRSTVMRWVRAGMPSQKVGGVRLFIPADVERWVAMQATREEGDAE